MSKTVILTIDSVEYNITSYVISSSLKITKSLFKDLEPTTNKVDFQISGKAPVITSILETNNYIGIRILENSTTLFTGYLTDSYSLTTRSYGKEAVSLSAEDYGIKKLKQCWVSTNGLCSVFANVQICKPTDTANSIIHKIAALAGVTVASSIPAITTYTSFSIQDTDNKTYWDILRDLTFENGYVFYFDENGYFNLYKIAIESAVASSTFSTTTNIVASFDRKAIQIDKKLQQYKKIDLTWKEWETKSNIYIFNDTTGGNDNNFCNIPVAAGAYYPAGADASIFVYVEYKTDDDTEIINVNSATPEIVTDSGFTYEFENLGNRGRIRIKNTSAVEADIRKFKILANSVILVKSISKTKACDLESDAPVLKYEAKHIHDANTATLFANTLRYYYKYGNFSYSFKSYTDIALGSVVNLVDNLYLQLNEKVLIIGKTTKDNGLVEYSAVGIDDFDLQDSVIRYISVASTGNLNQITIPEITTPSITLGTTEVSLGQTLSTIDGITVNGNIEGNSNTATKLLNARTIGLSGKVAASGVSFDGSQNITLNVTSAAITSAEITDATNANTANKIVKRDSSGNFAAGIITSNSLIVNTEIKAGTQRIYNHYIPGSTYEILTQKNESSSDVFTIYEIRSPDTATTESTLSQHNVVSGADDWVRDVSFHNYSGSMKAVDVISHFTGTNAGKWEWVSRYTNGTDYSMINKSVMLLDGSNGKLSITGNSSLLALNTIDTSEIINLNSNYTVGFGANGANTAHYFRINNISEVGTVVESYSSSNEATFTNKVSKNNGVNIHDIALQDYDNGIYKIVFNSQAEGSSPNLAHWYWRSIDSRPGHEAQNLLAVLHADTGEFELKGNITPFENATQSLGYPDLRWQDANFYGTVLTDSLTVEYKLNSADYTSGSLGTGWRLDYNASVAGKSYLEVDNLLVRDTLRTHIFQKDVIKATNGQLYVSDSGVIAKTYDGTEPYVVHFDVDKSATFSVNDEIVVKDVNLSSGTVTAITRFKIDSIGTVANGIQPYTVSVIEGTLWNLQTGMTAVRTSGGSVLIDASTTYRPFIDVLNGGVTKARLGNLAGISGCSGYGLYSDNVFLTGKIIATSGSFTGTISAGSGSTIGGWTSATDKLSSGNARLYSSGILSLGSADGYNTTNSIYLDGANSRFSLGTKLTYTGDTLTINGNGAFSGAVTATSGSFNGSITSNSATITGGSLSVGSNFSVTNTGVLTATNANIAGEITATSGSFTGTIHATDGLFSGSIDSGPLTLNKNPPSTGSFTISGSVYTFVNSVVSSTGLTGGTFSCSGTYNSIALGRVSFTKSTSTSNYSYNQWVYDGSYQTTLHVWSRSATTTTNTITFYSTNNTEIATYSDSYTPASTWLNTYTGTPQWGTTNTSAPSPNPVPASGGTVNFPYTGSLSFSATAFTFLLKNLPSGYSSSYAVGTVYVDANGFLKVIV